MRPLFLTWNDKPSRLRLLIHEFWWLNGHFMQRKLNVLGSFHDYLLATRAVVTLHGVAEGPSVARRATQRALDRT